MTLFETKRLYCSILNDRDYNFFHELLSNPKIINPIPQPEFSTRIIKEKFDKFLKASDIIEQSPQIRGIYIKGHTALIGLALFLKNEEGEHEIGYRFRPEYWGNGYGTEITKGLIDCYFNSCKVSKLTADVNTENIASRKILAKFMKPTKTFFCKRHQCTFDRYTIEQ